MKQLEWKGIGKTNQEIKSFLLTDTKGISNYIFGNRFLMQILVKGKGSPFNKNWTKSSALNSPRNKRD